MSETTNLKLFKHDNPSTNTNPFDVEQALNDNWNKIDTAVGDLQDDIKENNTNITNIDTRLTTAETDLETAKADITNIKAEQTTQNNNIEANSTAIEKNAENIEDNATDIQDLQAENANLKAQIPTGTAAGEEISLSDSAEMELVDFGLQGNSYQEIETGKNKARLPDMTKEINGMTVNIKDGVITITGKSNVTYVTYLKIGTAKIESGRSYYLNDFGKKSGSVSLYVNESSVWFPDNIGQEKSWQANESGTFNIQIGLGAGESQDWNLKLMLCEEEGQEWVEGKEPKPTLENPSEVEAVGDNGNVEIVKSNKNILDFGNVDSSKIKYENSRITIKDPTTYLYNTICNILNNNFLYGKTLSFTFVANGEVTGDNYVNLVFYTNKRSYLIEKIYNKGTYSNSKFSKTITLEDEERFNQCLVYTAGTTCDLTIDVQVEIADEASEVIEHEGNTYPIPVQKPFLKGDYFIKEDNQWKEVHLREKRNIKDDIQNAVLSSTTNFIYFPNLLASTAFYKTNNDDVGVISNILRHTSYNNMNNASIDYGIGISDAGSLVIRIKEFTTLEEYKNALNNENYYYYYPLRNPSKIECTGEQTQVLEQIIKDGTYKEVTHFYTTEDLKPIIEVKYYKDLETLFNKQAELENTLNNVQAQILELGGN